MDEKRVWISGGNTWVSGISSGGGNIASLFSERDIPHSLRDFRKRYPRRLPRKLKKMMNKKYNYEA